MSYGNFKDPLGLAKRMLRSGNPAAHFTMLREGLSVAAKPLDRLLQTFETARLRRAAKRPAPQPVLLILGGSRSGTTLLYQTLTQYLPVSYFSNLAAAFPRAPISVSKWLRPLLRKRKGDFNNYYGSVAGFGGPNDGFPIWDRWFGGDRNEIADCGDSATRDDMRRFFRAWQQAFPQAFVNKNNRNTLCVPAFEASLDDVRYLEIRRHPAYVAQSLIMSREEVQGSKHVGWGLKSTDSRVSRDPLGYVDDVCRQVYDVERALDNARTQVPPERYLAVQYEDFCDDPVATVRSIARFLGLSEPSAEKLAGLAPFKSTNVRRVSEEEWARILSCLEKFHGQDLPESQDDDRDVPRVCA